MAGVDKSQRIVTTCDAHFTELANIHIAVLFTKSKRFSSFRNDLSRVVRDKTRALIGRPPIIIADEPTAGLDISVQGEILNLLNQLQDEFGVSMLVITHNLNIVRHISDMTAIMYLGRFLEVGATNDIFSTPRHPYTDALLAANPRPDPDAEVEHVELKGEVPSLINRPTGCEFHTRCPFAVDECRAQLPSLTHTDAHYYRCHFPLGTEDVGDKRTTAT